MGLTKKQLAVREADRAAERLAKLMSWPMRKAHILKCMRALAKGEAVVISADKLHQVSDEIERLRKDRQ